MLINKNNLLAAKIISKNDTRAELTGLHVTPEFTEATDSYSMLRVATVPIDASELPTTEDYKPLELEEMILDGEGIKNVQFLKHDKNLPILDNVIVSEKIKNSIELSTTDLKNTATAKINIIKGNFPNVKQATEDMTKKAREIDLKLLSKTINTMIKMGIRRSKIEIGKEMLLLESKTKEDQKVEGIVMLIRK